MKKNILIAGACGQIGKVLTIELSKKNNIILFDFDKKKLNSVKIKSKRALPNHRVGLRYRSRFRFEWGGAQTRGQ